MNARDDHFLDLLGGLCNGNLAAEDERQLAEWLREDGEARRLYVRYMDLHLALTDLDLIGGEDSDSLLLDRVSEEDGNRADSTALPFSGVVEPLPRLEVPGGHWPGMVSYFSQVGPLSYLVATLILGVMLLSAWVLKVSHDSQLIAIDNSRGQTAHGDSAYNTPEMVFIGRVTAMKDCRWSDPETQTYVGASVPLVRKYALASGLMEITYSSGAKVILEGPCTYVVESPAGSYLSLGKLTARVRERGKGRGESEKPHAANPKSPNHQITKSPNPSPLSPLPSPLFTVRTPTAIVTDLGTEFGVEVEPKGETRVHVFSGKVEAEWFGQGGAAGWKVKLTAGQAAGFDRQRPAVVPLPARPQGFTRVMPGPLKQPFDVAAKKTIVKWSGVYRYGDPTKYISDWATLERFGAWHVNDGRTDETDQGDAYWLGRERTADEYFIIYLAGRFDVERIELINTHNGPGNDRGTKDFEIWASDEVDGENELLSPRLVFKGTLPCRFGAGKNIPADVFSVAAGDFPQFQARYVKFVAKTYYGGENSGGCGLNEIRVFAVPAPNKSRQRDASPAAAETNEGARGRERR